MKIEYNGYYCEVHRKNHNNYDVGSSYKITSKATGKIVIYWKDWGDWPILLALEVLRRLVDIILTEGNVNQWLIDDEEWIGDTLFFVLKKEWQDETQKRKIINRLDQLLIKGT